MTMEDRKKYSDDQYDELIIGLRDISHTMRFLYEGRGSQKRILIVLLEAGTITQRELTARLGIKPGSASEVLAKLEDAGLISRTRSENDRRTVNVELTEAGRSAAVEAAKQRQSRHMNMFACLSDDEKNTLLHLLEKINKDWDHRYRNTANSLGKRSE